MRQILKRLAARLPDGLQHELRRLNFAASVGAGRFRTDEYEYGILAELVRPGDWVLDIGANVGHYAFKLSQLVGDHGRVIAVEPVPETFAILAETTRRSGCRNVTLINAAASADAREVKLELPRFESGLANYYQASVTEKTSGTAATGAAPGPSETGGRSLSVLALPVDSLRIPSHVSLVKIDVEGHERAVLDGMRALLARDHPVLIIEGVSPEITALLAGFGYQGSHQPGSSNTVYRAASP